MKIVESQRLANGECYNLKRKVLMLEPCGMWLENWLLILQSYWAWIHISSLYNIAAALPFLFLYSARYVWTCCADPMWAVTFLGNCFYGPTHLGIVIRAYLTI